MSPSEPHGVSGTPEVQPAPPVPPLGPKSPPSKHPHKTELKRAQLTRNEAALVLDTAHRGGDMSMMFFWDTGSSDYLYDDKYPRNADGTFNYEAGPVRIRAGDLVKNVAQLNALTALFGQVRYPDGSVLTMNFQGGQNPRQTIESTAAHENAEAQRRLYEIENLAASFEAPTWEAPTPPPLWRDPNILHFIFQYVNIVVALVLLQLLPAGAWWLLLLVNLALAVGAFRLRRALHKKTRRPHWPVLAVAHSAIESPPKRMSRIELAVLIIGLLELFVAVAGVVVGVLLSRSA